MTDTDADQNPFRSFEDAASVLAFCYATYGEAGLRELLTIGEADRESLLRDAAVLADMGLPMVAAIVEEAAADAVPAAIKFCPYAAEDAHNFKNWHESHQRRQMTLTRASRDRL
jgi:hypothetical protein